MNSTDTKYINHKIFEELTYYAEFYESLSTSVMSFSTKGTTAIANMDTYVFMSMRGTIESIGLVLKNGNLDDAYALLRKYYDSVMINAYTNMYTNENVGKDSLYVTKINDGRVYVKERLQHLDQLHKDIRNVFILNIAYILMINEHYMVSSDYVDHLDCGMLPPENSQYWVATFIQDMVNKILLEERPDTLELLKKSTNMELA